MKYPELKETITTARALELCKHFEMHTLVERILRNPEQYKEWKFDGVSVLNEKFAAGIANVDQKTLTYQCALPHDLTYAYGTPGGKEERKRVDDVFKQNLLNKAHMSEFWASIFHKAVRIGGAEELGLSFTWAFAQKD